MKKQVSKLILEAGFLFVLCSCGGGPKGPFFWQVEKGGKTSYVLGTFHFGVALEDIQCSKEISNHLDNSDFLWTEGDLEMAQKLIQAKEESMFSTSGEEFQNLSEESKKFLKDKWDQLQSKGLVATDLTIESFSYYGLLDSISQFCLLENQNLIKDIIMGIDEQSKTNTARLDFQIQQIAQSKGMSQGSLDELEDLLALFISEVHPETIEKSVKDYNEKCNPEIVEKIMRDKLAFIENQFKQYMSGEKVTEIGKNVEMFKNYGLSDEVVSEQRNLVNQKLLKERNEKWLGKIMQSHENNNSIFVARGSEPFY